MSRFETDFAAEVVPALAEEFGQTGAYYAPGVETPTVSSLTVILQENEAIVEFVAADELEQRSAVVLAAVADLATAEIDGRFVVGADTWVIVQPPVARNGRWRCICQWKERITVGGKRRGD